MMAHAGQSSNKKTIDSVFTEETKDKITSARQTLPFIP